MKSAPELYHGAILSVAVLHFHFASGILDSFLAEEESPEIRWNRRTMLWR